MGGESQHVNETNDEGMTITSSLTPRRRQKKASGGFEFSVTPEPSCRRLSTSRGRQPVGGLEESPARYSPSKVKAAVRSFADFLHFLGQEEKHQEHALMPVIIKRFADLGAVIESQKRHIDRWKGKELDLAIEEAQQNLELIRELGETIQKQELQIAELTVTKQEWEEKYQLAALEVESLKKQGTAQIQQLSLEVCSLRQSRVEIEKKLKERDMSCASFETTSKTLLSQLQQTERDRSVIMLENATLQREQAKQSDKLRVFEQQIYELCKHSDLEVNKAKDFEQNVAAWQSNYNEKSRQVEHLEDALSRERQNTRQHEGKMNQLMDSYRKLQEHVENIEHEHEKQLADEHKYRREIEAERQRLFRTLEEESQRFQSLKDAAGRTRAQIEVQAMSAMKQREQQLLDEKARVEEELRLQNTKVNDENTKLRATVDKLHDLNQRKSKEIERHMNSAKEVEKLHQAGIISSNKTQQLVEKLSKVEHQAEAFSRDLSANNAAHEEALKTQRANFEIQYNELVSQAESQFNDLTQENEQLRADLDEKAKKLEQFEGQSVTEVKEVSKWQMECDRLQHQLQDGVRENDFLKLELENRLQQLNLHKKEIAELCARIEHLMHGDHEQTRQLELLQAECLRLDEHNCTLQRLVEETRVEAEATMDKAHRVHDHSVEQHTIYENTVRSLVEEKEAAIHNFVTLSSEKLALEAQIEMDKNDFEHWKVIVERHESEKQQLESRLQEVMLRTTEQIEMQRNSAALSTEEGRADLQILKAQLLQRDTQIDEGRQQVRSMQENARLLENRLRAHQDESNRMQGMNEQLRIELNSLLDEKCALERIVRQHSPSNLRKDSSGADRDIVQSVEQLIWGMSRRVKEASDKAIHLQALLDSKVDLQLQHSSSETAKLMEENRRLQHDLKKFPVKVKELDSELIHLQNEREERVITEMQQKIAVYVEDSQAQVSATDDSHNHLTAVIERYKQDILAQLDEKEKEVIELQGEVAEMQSKLEQEKEMTRHLMDRSRTEKKEHATKLLIAEDRMIELETTIKDMPRICEPSAFDKEHQPEEEKFVSQQSKTAKEQRARHENLHMKESDLQALQARYENLAAENAATHKKMVAKQEEVDDLHREVDLLHEEIDRLHAELRSNTLEMDNARSHLHVSELLMRKRENFQDDLVARGNDIWQRDAEISTKKEELQHAYNSEEKSKCEFEENMLQKSVDFAFLQQQNTKLREYSEKTTQEMIFSDAANSGARVTANLESKEAYEESNQREQELLKQIDDLKASKLTMLFQFRRELRDLNINFGAQGSMIDGSKSDDTAFYNCVMEVSALLKSYKECESRQDALLRRKEEEINELKTRINEFEHSIRLRDSRLRKRSEVRDRNSLLSQQSRAMRDEILMLKLQNKELHDKRTFLNGDGDPKLKKYAKPKSRGRDLKNNDTNLKQSHSKGEMMSLTGKVEERLSKGDVMSLTKKIEKLTTLVMKKNLQQTLCEASKYKLRSSHSALATKDFNYSRDLLEEKVMVLNGHLTGLMSENIQLQHCVEQYAIQFGPLEKVPTQSMIGDPGIRVSIRGNGGSSAIRSQ